MRRSARSGIGGLGDAPWVSQWTSAGYNDGGRILQFVQNQPNQPDGNGPVDVARATGKWVPWNGGYQMPGGISRLWMHFGLPTDQPGNPTGMVYLTDPVPAGFVSPGDDVMALAIQRWVGENNTDAGAQPAFSQAVPVMGGQTAAQAAQIAAINAAAVAGRSVAQAGGSAIQPSTGLWRGSSASPISAGLPAASSSPAGSAGGSANQTTAAATTGLSSIPWWVWAIGGAALLWYVMEKQ
jgi:hypothetical protein